MNKRKHTVQIGLGASSILMIFVVLCMMILSVLAYNHAAQNESIAKREVAYEEAYQKANTKGEILYEVLKQESQQKTTWQELVTHDLLQDKAISYIIQEQRITIKVEVNQQQYLQIVLQKDGSQISKQEWKLVSTGGTTS